MAKGSEERGARSQAIRDYFRENHKATVNEVVEALKARGITVKPGLVSNVKYGMKARKKARRKSGATVTLAAAAANHAGSPKRGSAAHASTRGISGDDLIEAKKLADQLGGVEKARQALELLSQLR